MNPGKRHRAIKFVKERNAKRAELEPKVELPNGLKELTEPVKKGVFGRPKKVVVEENKEEETKEPEVQPEQVEQTEEKQGD